MSEQKAKRFLHVISQACPEMRIVTLPSFQLSFAMGSSYILFFLISFDFGFSSWVLLPSIFPEKSEMKTRFSDKHSQDFLKNSTYENGVFCPDFHNLTAMTYGSGFKEGVQSQSDWEISLEDVQDLLKENDKLPKTSGERVRFVKQMENILMTEAEQRVKGLFSTSREARTKHFHSASMESALLTISMLLFGVYLSKLILKLLLSHYNRYKGGIAMMSGIRAPLTLIHGRKERSAQLQEIQLMHLIDKYNSQYN